MPSDASNLDFLKLLEVLSKHDVQFIVVGGMSAVLQGAPMATFDLDIVHERSAENIERLLAALDELDAKYRGQAGRVIKPDRDLLSGKGHSLLITTAGPLDVLGQIGEQRDFQTLKGYAKTIELGDALKVQILQLATLIEVKEETGRAKDLATLEILKETLRQTE